MSRHNISKADDVFQGAAYFAPYHSSKENTVGVPVTFGYMHNFGTSAPIATDIDYLMDAATSTELPDTETVSYTAASDDGTTPFDNGDTPATSSLTTSTGTTATVWALDIPRNIVVTTTHGASVVAMTVTVQGYDVYGVYMEEDIAVTATGTSQTDAGAKAFAYVSGFEITAAGDAEANTCNIGVGDVFGLPFRVEKQSEVIPFGDGALDASATIVVGDDTTATATTGDVRGTIDFNDAADASKLFAALIFPPDRDTKNNAFGISQYGG